MRLNTDLLRQRAKEIRDPLDVLARYGALSLEEFLARPETVDAAKYRLVVAIEPLAKPGPRHLRSPPDRAGSEPRSRQTPC